MLRDSDSDPDDPQMVKRLKRESTPVKKLSIRHELPKEKRSHHAKQHFRNEWCEKPEYKSWLTSVKGNPLKAKCKVCNSEFLSELTVIKNHGKGTKHLQNLKSSTKVSIDQMFAKKKNDPIDQLVKSAEIKLCGMIAKHNISFNFVDHLVGVLKSAIPDSKIVNGIQMGRTKATLITKNVIGSCHFENLIHKMQTQYFSILIDESTDIGALKSMCICVRYFDTKLNQIQTNFWSMVQVFTNVDEAVSGATGERYITKNYYYLNFTKYKCFIFFQVV